MKNKIVFWSKVLLQFFEGLFFKLWCFFKLVAEVLSIFFSSKETKPIVCSELLFSRNSLTTLMTLKLHNPFFPPKHISFDTVYITYFRHLPVWEGEGRPTPSPPGSCTPLFFITGVCCNKPCTCRHTHLEGQGLQAAVHAWQFGVEYRRSTQAFTCVRAGWINMKDWRWARG